MRLVTVTQGYKELPAKITTKKPTLSFIKELIDDEKYEYFNEQKIKDHNKWQYVTAGIHVKLCDKTDENAEPIEHLYELKAKSYNEIWKKMQANVNLVLHIQGLIYFKEMVGQPQEDWEIAGEWSVVINTKEK